MSLVYDHNYKYPEGGEFRKNQDFMDPYYPNQQQDQLVQTNGAARYRSAPSNFFDNDLENGGGNDGDDFRSFRSPSPEMDSFFAEVMKTEEKNEAVMEQNCDVSGSKMAYRDLGMQSSGNCGSSMDGSFSFMNNGGFGTRMQVKLVHNSLVKQHSSPPGLLSNLMMDNEFNLARESRDLKNSNNVLGDSNSSKNGVINHLNLEYRPPVSGSSIMPPQVSEIGSDFSGDSWNKTSFNVFKGTGGTNIAFSGSETQDGSSRNRLIHHLSLPTTFSERDTAEKFLHFQGTTVPCKVRAKRGFATHPRSIAERVRRNRISQRMKKLQDLFPDMDKQASTADMLDLAVDQIKELQKLVKALDDSRAKCRCSGKGKQN